MYDLLFESIELYEFKGINIYNRISKMNNNEIYEAINTLNNFILSENVDLHVENSLFNFIANNDLSGGIEHCSYFKCRLEKVIQLVNFTSLYSDVVLIQNPFEKYTNWENFNEAYKRIIADDIFIIMILEPLIKKGIIRFVVSEHHFCSECFKNFSSNAHYNYEDKLNEVTHNINTEFLNNINVFFENDDKYGFIEITGPEYLVDHGAQYIHFVKYTPQELMKYKGKNKKHKLSKEEIINLGIINNLSDKIVNDFAYRDWYTRNFDYNYITNRDLDVIVCEKVNDINEIINNRKIYDCLSHELPVITNVEIGDILKIREKDREAFLLYQNSIIKLFRDLPDDPIRVKEAFGDIVRPEILKIDIKLNEIKKKDYKNIARYIVVTSGVIGIGIMTGFLPTDIKQLITTAGVSGLSQTAVNSITDNKIKTNTIRENPYYFLWKVNKQLNLHNKW